MEAAKLPYDIRIGASPDEADLAIVSIDAHGNLGQLNDYVLKQYGYDEENLPGAELLRSAGFAIIEGTGSKPIIFIVTVEEGSDTRFSLEKNLYRALVELAGTINGKSVWIPLMGTGRGELTLEESYAITDRVLHKVAGDTAIHFSPLISLPPTERASVLLDSLMPLAGGDALTAFLEKLNTNFFLAGAFGNGAHRQLFNANIWEAGNVDDSKDLVNQIRKNDIIILRSFHPSSSRDFFSIKGLGVVVRTSSDGVSVEVDWTIKDINLDIELSDSYKDTLDILSSKDVLTIFSHLDPGLWQRLLPAPLETSLTIDHKIAGLLSDSEKGTDYLDIDKDIQAFARVIAARSFEPPLAIALFGKWGSGKSFFMRKLREQIEDFARHAASDMYCKGVVHIHFNAWSYMDANLWASFVSKIFEGLQGYIRSEKLGDQALSGVKNTLSQELNVTKGNIDALQDKKKVIEEQIKILEEKRKEALETVTRQIESLRSRTVWHVIENIDEEFDAREQIRASLRANATYTNTEEQLRAIVPEQYWDNPEEAYAQARSKYTFLKEFFTRKNATRNLVGLAVILVLIFLTPILLDLSGFAISKIDFGLSQATLSLLFTLGFIWRRAQAVYTRLQPVVASFWKIKENYEQQKEKALAAFEQEEKALKLEIEKGKEEILLFTDQIQKAEIISAELDFKIKNALASETLYTFIDERSKSDDYKKHLGIISIIRKDFEILNDLFIGHNDEVVKQGKAAAFRKYFNKPVERIILYIDDLDRCPEEHVVQVLEAVNLLMAFPLFVVVVGVDPRWVKNALIKKYALQFAGALNSGTVTGTPIEQIEPSDYLEKIFQVPFHLKDARPEHVKDMIRQLAGSKPVLKTIAQPLPETGTTATPVLPGNPGTDLPPSPSSTDDGLDATGFTDDLQITVIENTAFLELSEEEIIVLQDMGPIIGTNPRAIKRFVNIFKIVKAHEEYTLSGNDNIHELLAVVFLLALATGKYRCLIPTFEAFILEPGNIDRTLSIYLRSAVDIKHQKERAELDVMLAAHRDAHVMQNLSAGIFNMHHPFVKRFTFKNL